MDKNGEMFNLWGEAVELRWKSLMYDYEMGTEKRPISEINEEFKKEVDEIIDDRIIQFKKENKQSEKVREFISKFDSKCIVDEELLLKDEEYYSGTLGQVIEEVGLEKIVEFAETEGVSIYDCKNEAEIADFLLFYETGMRRKSNYG